jgi:hypothetical protein
MSVPKVQLRLFRACVSTFYDPEALLQIAIKQGTDSFNLTDVNLLSPIL